MIMNAIFPWAQSYYEISMVLGGGGDNLHEKFTGADKLGREDLGIRTLVVIMERVGPEIQAFSPLMYLDIFKLVVFKNTINRKTKLLKTTPHWQSR